MADEIFKQKARMTFALLDIKRDGIISREDRDMCEASYKAMFQPEGAQMEAMMENLANLWIIAVFLFETPDCHKTFTLDEFVENRMKWYKTDRAATLDALRKSVEHLFKAADVGGKNYFTFEDFLKVHKAFNIDNEEFVRRFFNIAGPDSSGICSLDAVIDFYTEFMTGNDEAKHKMIAEAFTEAGYM